MSFGRNWSIPSKLSNLWAELFTYSFIIILVSVESLVMFSLSYPFFFLLFLGLHSQHVEVPKLGVKLVLSLRHSHGQHGILNPLNEARDQTCILMVLYCWATMGTPFICGISNFCPLFFLAWLKTRWFHWYFQRNIFGFVVFFCIGFLFSVSLVSALILVISFILLTVDFFCSFLVSKEDHYWFLIFLLFWYMHSVL